jgi:hypothetical protein
MLQDQPVFNNCHDVCVDGRDLYVCQWASGNVYPTNSIASHEHRPLRRLPALLPRPVRRSLDRRHGAVDARRPRARRGRHAQDRPAEPPPLRPKAKRVIFLTRVRRPPRSSNSSIANPASGELAAASELPESVRRGPAATTTTDLGQKQLIMPGATKFEPPRPVRRRASASGCRTSGTVADDLCFVKSMQT